MEKEQLPGNTTQSVNVCRRSCARLQPDNNTTNVRPENLNGHVGNGESPGDGFLDHEVRIAKPNPILTDLNNA